MAIPGDIEEHERFMREAIDMVSRLVFFFVTLEIFQHRDKVIEKDEVGILRCD